jgi:outer membrane protein TolC
MSFFRRPSTVLRIVALLAVAEGCRLRNQTTFKSCSDDCYRTMATEVSYPGVAPCSAVDPEWGAVEPLTLVSAGQMQYWNLTLQEAVQIALAESQVMRDLGGTLLRTPAAIKTHWDPALVDTNPRFGVDAALSAFDAQLTTSVFGEKNDRALNNEFFGGGTRLLQQDAAVMQAQIAKRSAIGSMFALRHYTDYDANNAPSNLFPSAWNTRIEAEVRQPLLQGAGATFNRIAGPGNVPGLYTGVLVARVNTDVELAEFELAVRDLVSNVENAYWDLYFAYRDLDAKIAARDAALDTWRRIHALFQAGRRGGEAEKEAQAREQYYRFQEDVENALSGRLLGGTSVNNGSSGGTFRAIGGVQVSERRLRLIIGLPPSDGRLIRPADEPVTAPIHFDWQEITRESLVRRVELRRQRWLTRRFELEHIASRNYLLPRLDAVGRYRWRGFGDDLLHSDSTGRPRFDNAYADLTSGDFQEWQLGVELSVPLGFRQAAAAVRNAEIMLTRSRAVLREQEHLVLHDAASSVAEFDRAVVVAQTTARRLDAARTQSAAVEAAYDADKAPLDLMLEAQRRLADADSRYYQSLAEYAIAVKNVHFAKGTLLDYDGVALSESAWPAKAYVDAAERNALRSRPRPLNYISARAPIVSAGPYDQRPLSGQPPNDAVAPPPEEGAAPGEAIQPQQPPPLVLPTPVAQIAPTGLIEPVAYTPPAEGAPSGAGP